ncbi:iron-containing alcohol dehydrogenase [Metabacillus sp. RGM 3146]|uniref:iron-containing alcohol dehydrogenase n=1 Tax=Metabacillus sp. RGM 3146 TaxID=3401092 RepID=UPI003B9A590B
MSFNRLLVPGEILYGIDSFKETGKLVSKFGTKALIISDPVMEKNRTAETCKDYLLKEGISSSLYAGIESEPTDLHVDEALSICKRENCDVIIAIGGGSCIDTGKAAAAIMTNGGHIRDYSGGKKEFTKKPLPFIAVPTTAGTGSEATKVTVITDTKSVVKMMISQPALLPAAAIVDPVLTMSCPPHVTAATGVDAICHAVEAFISRRSQPLTDTLALKAIELIMGSIRTAFENGEDKEARNQMSLGSMLAGMAFSNSTVTLVHGMSRPIGAMFHVPHGISNAMLLPAVLEFTKKEAADRLAEIAFLLKPESKGKTSQEAAEEFIQDVKLLCMDLQIPNLCQWGIDRTQFIKTLPKMAEDALASGSPCNNPKVPAHSEIKELYQVCYNYNFSANPSAAR